MFPHAQTILANSIPMRPLENLPVEWVPGNCMQAAFASLLDLPLEAVPHFALFPSDWRRTIRNWLHEHGKRLRVYADDDEWRVAGIAPAPLNLAPTHQMMIAVGRSPRGLSHTVVWKSGQLVWDPHPSQTGLSEVPTEYWQVTDS